MNDREPDSKPKTGGLQTSLEADDSLASKELGGVDQEILPGDPFLRIRELEYISQAGTILDIEPRTRRLIEMLWYPDQEEGYQAGFILNLPQSTDLSGLEFKCDRELYMFESEGPEHGQIKVEHRQPKPDWPAGQIATNDENIMVIWVPCGFYLVLPKAPECQDDQSTLVLAVFAALDLPDLNPFAKGLGEEGITI